MPYLEVPGAKLFYETRGKGPCLILITGKDGQGSMFHQLAACVDDHFTAITYDRRGHSQSALTGEQDYAHRLERDADDAAALVAHLSPNEPAYAIGNSSGAIVAMALLLRHADKFRYVCLHEPPLLRAMPDAEEMLKAQQEMYDLYRAKGHVAAVRHFAPDALSEGDLAGLAAPRGNEVYADADTIYWFEREFLQYPPREIDWAGLERVKPKLLLGISREAPTLTGGKGAQALAERLGLTPDVYPGGHVGFLTHPEKFANALVEALEYRPEVEARARARSTGSSMTSAVKS